MLSIVSAPKTPMSGGRGMPAAGSATGGRTMGTSSVSLETMLATPKFYTREELHALSEAIRVDTVKTMEAKFQAQLRRELQEMEAAKDTLIFQQKQDLLAAKDFRKEAIANEEKLAATIRGLNREVEKLTGVMRQFRQMKKLFLYFSVSTYVKQYKRRKQLRLLHKEISDLVLEHMQQIDFQSSTAVGRADEVRTWYLYSKELLACMEKGVSYAKFVVQIREAEEAAKKRRIVESAGEDGETRAELETFFKKSKLVKMYLPDTDRGLFFRQYLQSAREKNLMVMETNEIFSHLEDVGRILHASQKEANAIKEHWKDTCSSFFQRNSEITDRCVSVEDRAKRLAIALAKMHAKKERVRMELHLLLCKLDESYRMNTQAILPKDDDDAMLLLGTKEDYDFDLHVLPAAAKSLSRANLLQQVEPSSSALLSRPLLIDPAAGGGGTRENLSGVGGGIERKEGGDVRLGTAQSSLSSRISGGSASVRALHTSAAFPLRQSMMASQPASAKVLPSASSSGSRGSGSTGVLQNSRLEALEGYRTTLLPSSSTSMLDKPAKTGKGLKKLTSISNIILMPPKKNLANASLPDILTHVVAPQPNPLDLDIVAALSAKKDKGGHGQHGLHGQHGHDLNGQHGQHGASSKSKKVLEEKIVASTSKEILTMADSLQGVAPLRANFALWYDMMKQTRAYREGKQQRGGDELQRQPPRGSTSKHVLSGKERQREELEQAKKVVQTASNTVNSIPMFFDLKNRHTTFFVYNHQSKKLEPFLEETLPAALPPPSPSTVSVAPMQPKMFKFVTVSGK